MRQWLISIGIFIASLIVVNAVFAHANLESSEPAANAALESPPKEIRLWFTEPLEAEFSQINLRDSQGNQVETLPSQMDPNDPYQMFLRLDDLADGVYTVSWRVLSTADGHSTQGSFPISIGAGATSVVSPENIQESIPADNAAVRWISVVSLSLAIGSIGFMLFTWQPVIQNSYPLIEKRMLLLMWIGWLLLGITGILGLALQVAIRTGDPILQAITNPATATVVVHTRYGTLWLIRTALWVGLGGALIFARRDRWFYWVALAIGGGILLMQSLYSHASAAPEALPAITADWLHLLATAFWVGGLVQFINIINPLRKEAETSAGILSTLVGHFSNLARVSVATLILTGLYGAWLHVGSIEGLLTTLYGQALLVKLILIVPLLALGGVNLVLTHSRLQAGKKLWENRFRWLIGMEIVLAVGVLAAVGAMTSVAPSRSTLAARASVPHTPEPMPIIENQTVDDINTHLEISPGWSGENIFTVMLTDDSGKPIEDASRIRMRFENQTQNLGESELRPEHQGDGIYSVSGANLSTTGTWRIRTTIQRPDKFDVLVDFTPEIGLPPAPTPVPVINHAPSFDSRIIALMLMGIAALGIGGFFIAGERFRLNYGSRLIGSGLAICGTMFLCSGILTWQSAPAIAAPDTAYQAPPNAPLRMAFGHKINLPYLVTASGELLQPQENATWQAMDVDASVKDIYLDSSDQIWAATNKGLEAYLEGEWQTLDSTPIDEIEMTHGYLYLMGDQLKRVPADGDMEYLRPLTKPEENEAALAWVMLGNHSHVLQNGNDVFLTRDLGLSWEAINAPEPIEHIATDVDGQLIASTASGLFTWDNQNWRAFLPLPDNKRIDAIQTFNNRLYAAAGGKFYQAAGSQWKVIDLPDADEAYLISVRFQYPDGLWVLDSSQSRLWSSKDGTNWTMIPIILAGN